MTMMVLLTTEAGVTLRGLRTHQQGGRSTSWPFAARTIRGSAGSRTYVAPGVFSTVCSASWYLAATSPYLQLAPVSDIEDAGP